MNATPIRPGDTVRDTKLNQVWTVVERNRDGTFSIERNGVRAAASQADLVRYCWVDFLILGDHR